MLEPVKFPGVQTYVLAPVAVNVTDSPLHILVWLALTVTEGLGFTVTVTVKSEPVQDPEIGVTVYTTLIGALVVLVKVPEIEAATEPEEVPVMPAILGADQE